MKCFSHVACLAMSLSASVSFAQEDFKDELETIRSVMASAVLSESASDHVPHSLSEETSFFATVPQPRVATVSVPVDNQAAKASPEEDSVIQTSLPFDVEAVAPAEGEVEEALPMESQAAGAFTEEGSSAPAPLPSDTEKGSFHDADTEGGVDYAEIRGDEAYEEAAYEYERAAEDL